MGIEFPVLYYYDGQGVMAHKSGAPARLEDLDSQSICVLDATTTENTLSEYITIQRKPLKPVRFRDNAEAFRAFFEHRCDLITTDRMVLAAQRALLAPDPSNYVIYPDIISKEPLAPAVRDDDDQWAAIVRWTMFTLIAAEEKAVTSANLGSFATSANPELRRLLGRDAAVNQRLGLDADWGAHVIAGVGNYGEIFDRNLGPSTPLRLERGINALWSQGGLIYAPPFL
jgi:general L-amino acid transport system substrate-binding protein